MIQFLEQTWVYWWMVAIVAILRWFYQMSEGAPTNSVDLLEGQDEIAHRAGAPLLESSASEQKRALSDAA